MHIIHRAKARSWRTTYGAVPYVDCSKCDKARFKPIRWWTIFWRWEK